ncbi:MAG: TatD family hydrolase [Saprospiraceae bacterium]|nr:TatD family hydrolase [Saprospiraceae bacterium]
MIDTHAHLYLEQFDDDRAEVMDRAQTAGVQQILLPNIDSKTVAAMHALVSAYPDRCKAMMGLHPCSVDKDVDRELVVVEQHLSQRPYVAVGEIGLDYYWDKTHIEEQKEAFRVQTKWAHSLALPIVIHSRDSIDDILEELEKLALPGLRGVFHCFTGDTTQIQRILDLSFLMGIGGVLTFKNGGLDKVAPSIPLNSIVLETDAPYLTPHPYRGKRNESSYVALVAEKLADILAMQLEEVAQITTRNAKDLFTC